MSTSVTPIEEANLIDLNDEELKDYLLHSHEAIKNLEEQKRADPDLQQMQDRMKAYVNDNYSEEIKTQKARLKAARAQAKNRGLKIRLPGDK
jgi:sensor histidine kinase YesM